MTDDLPGPFCCVKIVSIPLGNNDDHNYKIIDKKNLNHSDNNTEFDNQIDANSNENINDNVNTNTNNDNDNDSNINENENETRNTLDVINNDDESEHENEHENESEDEIEDEIEIKIESESENLEENQEENQCQYNYEFNNNYIPDNSITPEDKLFMILQDFIKQFNLNEQDDINFIKSSNDSEILFNYIIFKNQDIMDKFILKIKENNFEFEIINSENDFNSQVPGHLFINGLLSNTTAEDLFNIFKKFGEITSCKVIFDDFGNSKNFGFINFKNKIQSNNAINSLNGCIVNGNKLFINYHISKKDRLNDLLNKFKNSKNLIIKNLPLNVTNDNILNIFNKYGEIVSIFTPQDLKNDYAFVNFKYYLDANNALNNLQNSIINLNNQNYKILIEKAYRKKDKLQYKNLVNHFNYKTQLKNLQRLSINNNNNNNVNGNGNCNNNMNNMNMNNMNMNNMNMNINNNNGNGININNINNMNDLNNNNINQPKFIYNHQNKSHELLSLQSSSHLQPHPILLPPQLQHLQMPPPQLQPQLPQFPIPGPMDQENNLYIKNLPYNFNNSDLFNLFSKFGNITSCKIINNENEIVYGFVSFYNNFDASKSIFYLNGYVLDNGPICVNFAKRRNYIHR